ncbi:MAG: hypothetical protein HC860_06600 [Alkalinema sp. RU_4_3]|nr:hypothetical protein [Alkalinema sp. RU_4_3]
MTPSKAPPVASPSPSNIEARSLSAVLPSQLEQPLQAIAPKRVLTKLTNKAKSLLQPKAKPPTKIAAAPVKPKQVQKKQAKPQAPMVFDRPEVIAPQPPAVMPQVSVAPLPTAPVIMPAAPIAPAPPWFP